MLRSCLNCNFEFSKLAIKGKFFQGELYIDFGTLKSPRHQRSRKGDGIGEMQILEINITGEGKQVDIKELQ